MNKNSSYKNFLENTFNNMIVHVNWLSNLNGKNIKKMFEIKWNFLDVNNYEAFVNEISTNYNFESNKEFLKENLNEFLMSYLTTLIKNSIIKIFYKRAIESKLSYENYIEAYNYIIFYYKIKNKDDSLFDNIKIE